MFGRVYAPSFQDGHDDAFTRRPTRSRRRATAPLADVLAFHAANPIMEEFGPHMEEYGENDFLRDLLRKCVQYGSLSEKQLAAARKAMDRTMLFRAERAAEAATAADVPTGRIEVTGEVMSIKDKGWGPKMIVKHADGWKVWGSVPTSLTSYVPGQMNISNPNGMEAGTQVTTVQVGDTVKFTATITASDEDPKFGFFKRPTAAGVTARQEAQD